MSHGASLKWLVPDDSGERGYVRATGVEQKALNQSHSRTFGGLGREEDPEPPRTLIDPALIPLVRVRPRARKPAQRTGTPSGRRSSLGSSLSRRSSLAVRARRSPAAPRGQLARGRARAPRPMPTRPSPKPPLRPTRTLGPARPPAPRAAIDASALREGPTGARRMQPTASQ